MAHLDVESVEATGPQGIHRQGDHLQVRFHPRGTQHLHATLGNLAAATLVGIPRAEHGLIVVQPLGQRQGLQFGGRQPCDGGGGVRAHDHDLARSVNDFQHGLLGQRAPRVDKQVIKLHLRSDDLRIAPAAEQVHQGTLHLTPLQALGKEPVPGPLWGIEVYVHGVSSLSLAR